MEDDGFQNPLWTHIDKLVHYLKLILILTIDPNLASKDLENLQLSASQSS